MTKILCLLLIAVLAAQICAIPDDKKADPAKDVAKDAKDAAKDAAKEAAGDKDKVEKGAKEAEKDTEDEAKKLVGEGEKAAKDCEEPLKKHKPHHNKGPISKTATVIQAVVDSFFGLFE